jgi:flagellar hook-length control protein FliK
VRVTHGPLGPITVELELCQGRVELQASASNSRAAEALRAGEGALREGLAQAGLQLDSMQVTVGRRRAMSGTRPSSRRKDQGQEES